MIKKNKEEILGILVFISYYIYSYCTYFPLSLLGISPDNLSLNDKIFYLIIYEAIYILIIIYIYKDIFIKNFKDFIKNKKEYIKNYFKYWSIAFGLMIVANIMAITIFPDSVATNQEAVNNILKQAPGYMIISSVIFAPILEESIFRLSIRKMFKTDKIFIIMSGFVFGSMHVIGSFSNLQDLIYIIPYSIPGFVFAYTLVKSKNIFVPISLHFFHNFIMMSLQVIITFLI